MKILLIGKNGQVGWELQRSCPPSATWSRWIILIKSCAVT